MGTFLQRIAIGDFEARRFEEVDALVDTGATFTSIPGPILEQLGIVSEEERPFVIANGQRGLAWIRVRLEDREQPTLAILGDPGSEPLVGAFTLEGFGLSVDAPNHRLVTKPGFLVGTREAVRPD